MEDNYIESYDYEGQRPAHDPNVNYKQISDEARQCLQNDGADLLRVNFLKSKQREILTKPVGLTGGFGLGEEKAFEIYMKNAENNRQPSREEKLETLREKIRNGDPNIEKTIINCKKLGMSTEKALQAYLKYSRG